MHVPLKKIKYYKMILCCQGVFPHCKNVFDHHGKKHFHKMQTKLLSIFGLLYILRFVPTASLPGRQVALTTLSLVLGSHLQSKLLNISIPLLGKFYGNFSLPIWEILFLNPPEMREPSQNYPT